jgi:Hypoxia induced protein conserved region
MQTLLPYLTLIALAAVAVVLSLGLLNMARGTSANMSQTLMRWRVGLQFVAIIVLMATVYLTRR